MKFLKTTVVGGLVFLVPISVAVLILGKTFTMMSRLAAPLAGWLPVDSIGGIALANLLAVVAIVAVCFLAGLIAKSRLATRLVGSLESRVLYSLPGYAFIKGLIGGLTEDDADGSLTPVLARFDDTWQIAFRVEDLSDGRIVLYIPGAPDPWSGSLNVMAPDRVEPLGLTMAAAVRLLRTLGRGSSDLLSPGSR